MTTTLTDSTIYTRDHPTIEERVAVGRDAQSDANCGIVPTPEKGSFRAVPLPAALSGKQAGDIKRLLNAEYVETARYVYTAPGGEEIMAVCRLENADGKKEFRPLRFRGKAKDGRYIYDLTTLEPLRPLYNLHHIHARADAIVLFVEGEKAAEGAAKRFPDLVVTTWPNGANSVGKVDLRDVAGRDVVVWPDNDKAGRAAADKLSVGLLAVGCNVRMVAVPVGYPEKYDLADPDPQCAADELNPAALLTAAKPFDPARAAAILRAGTPQLKPSVGNVAEGNKKAEVTRCFNAVRFLGTTGKRDYSSYFDWFDLMCAAKNTFGDDGFAPFVDLSCEYGGTDTEAQFRSKWDGLAEKPEGERKTMATFIAEASAAGWDDPGGASGGEAGGSKGSRSDPASIVLEQSAEAGDILWADQHGKPHVSMLAKGADGVERVVHARVGSKRHKGIVSSRYRAAHKNKVLSGEQEKRAMLLLEHDARESGVTHESANRAIGHDGSIYVDLGRADGKIVRVACEGWTVVDESPVRFVRGNRGELPLPERGGVLADFERHLNLSPQNVVRVVAFVIGALSPLGSFPILLIEGRQGTAKSTIGDMVLLLCDPPHGAKGARLTMPRGEQNLIVHAGGVRVVFIDNMSDISSAEADSLCRLATGGGTSARQHYSDDDEVQLNAVRPTIVTAIGTPTGRGDFLDRCVRVTAMPIARRRTEEAVLRDFDADRPRMFGFVLDALAAALRRKTEMDAAAEAGDLKLARMADFCLYIEGASEVLGLRTGEFSAALMDEQATMQAEGALGDALGEALARYFTADGCKRKALEGHATEVLDQLRSLLPDPSLLPASNKLKGGLRRIEPGLADLGITVEIREPTMGTRNRKTYYRLATTEGFQPIGEQLPF